MVRPGLRTLSGPPWSALVGYSVAISKAVAASGVTVNRLLPGMYDTDGIRRQGVFADTFLNEPFPSSGGRA